MHITITFHFDAIFIIIMCVERQNVVVKRDILTKLEKLKPRTKNISTLHMLIPCVIFQLIIRLVIFDLVRAKKQHMMPLWVCPYLSFFATFDEKDDLSNCDFWRANTQSILSLAQGSLRIQIKIMFSMREMLTLEYFVPSYVHFVRRSTLII